VPWQQRKASKFGNCPSTVEVPGHRRMSFHSGKEAARAVQLGALEQAGAISGLRFQPRYPIDVNGARICTYVADFEYEEKGNTVVEDVKGVKTEVYKFKARLMKAVHGIEVRET